MVGCCCCEFELELGWRWCGLLPIGNFPEGGVDGGGCPRGGTLEGGVGGGLGSWRAVGGLTQEVTDGSVIGFHSFQAGEFSFGEVAGAVAE